MTTTFVENLRVTAVLAAMLIAAVLLTATGFDIKNSLLVPAAAGAFALYSLVAFLIDRRKNVA